MAKDLDKQYVWHPFTQMKGWIENDQIIIERGDGVYLYDSEGNKYLDGVSSLWVTVHGHRKKEIDQAIEKQLKKIAHSTLLGLANAPSNQLANKLVEITPKGLDKVFYSDNGSTAVEIALKIAFQYWQNLKSSKSKKKFLTLVNAYHGDTIGSVSVGGIDLFHRIYKPLLFKAYKVRPDLNEVEKIMKAHHHEIAAMIVEPLIQAAAGMLLQPKGFLKGIRKLCTKYNILLICDEVATGFGRTGKMFACEHEGISPDIMCLAKGITGGYLPIAATLTTQKIFDAFLGKYEEMKAFFHGHTYTGNPLGCAAALANLEVFRREKTIKNLQKKIKLLKDQIKRFENLEHVGEIRQCGFMVGIELVNFSYADRIGHKVILEARKRGAILRPLGNVIVLMPPLGISNSELKRLLDIIYESIKSI
jgi:adenosylmethionine-8-amino-7-oxononanoate aminotransferase